MKRLLIATAALVLVGAGTAAAQDARTSPTGVGTAASTAGGPNTPPNPTTSFDQDQKPTAAQAGWGSKSSATNSTTAMATTTSGAEVVGDLSSTNPPPAAGSYPPCRHKGQDRCVVTAQLKRHSATRTGA